MAGYVMKMSILVPNINHRGQKDLSFEVRHKAYAARYHAFKMKQFSAIFLFIMSSHLLFGQVCDTIEEQIINCIDSEGLKQGKWKEIRKILLFSADSDFGPGSGHKDYCRNIILSEGQYLNSKKVGTWKYYRNFNNEQGAIEKTITYLNNGNCVEDHFYNKYNIEYNTDTTYITGHVYLDCDTVGINLNGNNISFMTSTEQEFLSCTRNNFEYKLSRLVRGFYNREIKNKKNAW